MFRDTNFVQLYYEVLKLLCERNRELVRHFLSLVTPEVTTGSSVTRLKVTTGIDVTEPEVF